MMGLEHGNKKTRWSKLRLMVKRILRQYKFPADVHAVAVDMRMNQLRC
jgi:hypothetical protein